MRLPNTFRPNKNLDEKTRQLKIGPKKKSKMNLFQDGMDLYNLNFEELENRVDLHDHLKSVTFNFKYGGFIYYVTFSDKKGVLNVKLNYIRKMSKKSVVPKATQRVIDELGECYETSPVWSQEFTADEHIYTWEFVTNEFFDTPKVLYEIKLFFQPPIFKEFEVYCVDLGW
jgi:hypothetical protein